jgi:hypothetical protein
VYQTATLNVKTVFSNGFYFLKETAGGNTELDFHTPDGAGGWTTAFDILEAQLGAPITGAPTSLGMISSYPYINKANGQPETGAVLVPIGGRDMKVMLLNDMSLVYDHNEIFFSGVAPDHKPIRAYYLSLFDIPVFISDKGAYSVNSSTGKVGYPVAPAEGCVLSHGMMTGILYGSSIGQLMFFDALNGQLVYYTYGGDLMSLSGTPSPTGITHRPLFMGTGGWCVFEDPGTSDRYLYSLKDASTTPILEIRSIDAATAPNFNSADIYGSNKTNTQILYGGAGNRIWMYNTGNSAETALTLQGMGAGETITMITHKRGVYNPADRSDTAGYLFIATQKGGNYKVYMYKVTGGETDGEPIIVEGTGKVIDMQYAGGTSVYNSSYSISY